MSANTQGWFPLMYKAGLSQPGKEKGKKSTLLCIFLSFQNFLTLIMAAAFATVDKVLTD